MKEKKYFTISWRIKNFSFCWHQNEEELSSPSFFIEGLPGTIWTLFLFPKATKSKEDGLISCYLRYESVENGPHEVEIDYELSILGCDGLPLQTTSSAKYTLKENDWAVPLLLEQKIVFLEQRDVFLPNDSLTVRCRIWQISKENLNAEQYFATTRIEVEKSSVFGVVKKIDYCRFREERYSVKFLSASAKTAPILMNIKVTEEGPYAEIKPGKSERLKFCKCNLHFTDDQQNEKIYGRDEFLFHFDMVPLYVDTPVWSIPLKYTSKPHLEIDKLTLRCEIAYSVGITSEKIEKVDYSVNMIQNGYHINEKRQEDLPSSKEDLLSCANKRSHVLVENEELERNSFTITWRIKNFSFCWQKDENSLPGPTFCIEGLEGSTWSLFVFPRASRFKQDGSIAIYLHHENEDDSRREVEIDYELSVLDSDGLPLEIETFSNCTMGGNDWSAPLLLKKKRVFLEMRSAFLPKDSLTVRCRIWYISQENINAERYFATTRIEVEKGSIFGVVKKVDCNHGKRYSVNFISASSETAPILMDIIVTECGPDAEIKPTSSELMKFCKCKLHFTDSSENEIVSGQSEFLFHSDMMPLYGDTPVWIIPLTYISKYNITQPHFEMENLTLRCEITYSVGIASEDISKIDYSMNMFQNGCRIKEKRQEHLPSLKDDLLSVMQNADYSDIKLQTKTETFPAHRNILSARSLFFKTKLADQNNMGSTIYVEDLDNEILHQVLVFLYTDIIENLEIENATDLYVASARYGIPSLKHRCSIFLQNHLDSSICCEVLRAADKYQDSDLKKAAQNYILEHEDEVIGSEKWEDLDCFTELTEEIMCLKRMKN